MNKNWITGKVSLDCLNKRMEMADLVIIELEDVSIKFIHLTNREKIGKQKASGACGTMTKEITLMSESNRKGK